MGDRRYARFSSPVSCSLVVKSVCEGICVNNHQPCGVDKGDIQSADYVDFGNW